MLNQRDLLTVTRRLPARLRELMKDSGSLFVAGGFIRACISGEDVSDIDVFTYEKERAKEAACDFAGEGIKCIETDNAFTVPGRPPIQFIHRWTFDRPESCVASFDFTIAQAAVWYEQGEWRSHCADTYYEDLAARRLVYTKPGKPEAGASILRMIKFIRRGYKISMEDLAALLAAFARMDRGGNMDTEQVFRGLLREVDPLIDPDGVMD